MQVLYFQLNTDGTQSWMIGTAAPDGSGGYSAQLIEPTGTQFGSAFDKTRIDKSVAYPLSMQLACSNGTASIALGPGSALTFALQRLTTPAGIAACTP